MNAFPIRAAAMATLFALALAGCGGHTDTSSTTTTTQDNAAASPGANAENAASANPTNGAMTAGMEGMHGAPTGTAAPVPANLNCGTDLVVWANPKRKNYHLQSDPYYGRTTHGTYMCEAAAKAKGYHLAGHHSGGSMNNTMNGTATPTP